MKRKAIPEVVTRWLLEHDHGEVERVEIVSGGCINQALALVTTTQELFFLKVNADAPADMFACESEGLAALALAGGLRIPEVFFYGNGFILMTYLQHSSACPNYWRLLGAGLAVIHNHSNPRFGFKGDNYIGASRQVNAWMDDGYEFFAINRLLFQAQKAFETGLLDVEELRRAERIAGKLSSLIPGQPASLLHGDLWHGNVITDSRGFPALIDPAVYYGWAEADLAMTTLFGKFPAAFYQAYTEQRHLEPGYEERFPIYNLYHILNHVNMFGGSYLPDARRILEIYG